jgi:hypothetical protein
MLVRKDREYLYNLLDKYIKLEIDNFTLADSYFFSEDVLVREILYEVDINLSEYRRHYCESEILKDIFTRFCILLASDFEFSANYHSRIPGKMCFILRLIYVLYELIKNNFCVVSYLKNNIYWPLTSQDDWDKICITNSQNIHCPNISSLQKQMSNTDETGEK